MRDRLRAAGDVVRRGSGHQGASHSEHLHHRQYHEGQHLLPALRQKELLTRQKYNLSYKRN